MESRQTTSHLSKMLWRFVGTVLGHARLGSSAFLLRAMVNRGALLRAERALHEVCQALGRVLANGATALGTRRLVRLNALGGTIAVVLAIGLDIARSIVGRAAVTTGMH